VRATCSHQDMIRLRVPSEPDKADAVCEDCIRIGSRWVHLRMCLTCGRVGCCDSSPNRHARAHASVERHPLVTSYEPDEHWRYCFEDDVFLR
jgi:uncharacterized UBP type Zn finger protein